MSQWRTWLLLVLCGCSTQAKTPGPTTSILDDTSQLSADTQAYAAELKTTLQSARQVSTDELLAQHAPALSSELPYDPMSAQHLDLIQGSNLRLNDSELAKLGEHGFTVSSRQPFPSFMYGYASIYAEDLPVFISADSILDALHRSYDKLLVAVESELIMPELANVLNSALSAARALPQSATQQDLVVYLAVADALLRGTAPTAGGTRAGQLVQQATDAAGPASFSFFGVDRNEDMSQFTPRGHYTSSPELQQYFRAMIWLGRVDLRLVETRDDGSQVLRRNQVEAMFMLDELLTADARQRVERIDNFLQVFVGESDNMTIAQLPALREALGITSASQLTDLSDQQLQRVILRHAFGKQQIASHLMLGGLDHPQPLNASFLLLGQRYSVDSHVLSNVSWDRTHAQRMLPDALDVAFAALGNGQALSLLREQLDKYQYAGDLNGVRAIIDSNAAKPNLYNAWLDALRTLSPSHDTVTDPAAHSSPSIVASEAWGRRILNTQLASWAELRHDTLLYVKQSYTSGAVCQFPDAAVEPYPNFFAAVASFADRGSLVVSMLPNDGRQLGRELDAYLRDLRDVAIELQGIAQAQREQRALSDEQLAFINDAVVIKKEPAGCTTIDHASGWYTRLFFRADPLEFDPTIADVHTQPTDEAGSPVGRVLHVATGQPNLMVVTLDGCSGGPRAYVGLASSYYERITENFKRMTDMEWAKEVREGKQASPTWMRDLLQ